MLALHSIGNYNFQNITLGKGSFARVELAKHTLVDSKVAIKVFDLTAMKDPYVKRNLHREGLILSKLEHPNIVRLFEIVSAERYYCLVLQYMQGAQTLGNLMAEGGQFANGFPEPIAANICSQLVSALIYMHSVNILHRDLKTENILISQCFTKCLLIDFGLSNFWQPGQHMNTHCGSAEFAAPELFRRDPTYGPGIDVWSFGVVLFCLVLGRLPFEAESQNIQTLIKKIFRGLTKSHQAQMRHLSHACIHLITACLETNRLKRIAFPEVAVHPWIISMNFQVDTGLQDIQSCSSDILREAVEAFCQKVQLQIPPNKSRSSHILNYISKRPFNTTAGCFNLIVHKIREQRQDAKASEAQKAPTPARDQRRRLRAIENLPQLNRSGPSKIAVVR